MSVCSGFLPRRYTFPHTACRDRRGIWTLLGSFALCGRNRYASGSIDAAAHAQPSVELVTFAFEDGGPLGLVLGECFEENENPGPAGACHVSYRHSVAVSQSVRPGSAADSLGVVPGLLLHSVGSQPVKTTPVHLGAISLTIVRDGG
eukprot:COSAG01_NODE_5562_length_4179_cov_8.225514_5_plen_147_part_00